MNIILFCILYCIGLTIFFKELYEDREPRFLIFLFFVFFVLTSISRKDGYHSYSDLGSYIWRFATGDDAYFGIGYKVLTNMIHRVTNSNISIYLGIIAILIMLCWYVAGKIIAMDENATIRNSNNSYIGSFLFIFAMYWGLSFSTEVIRTGIAISFSTISVSIFLQYHDYINRRKRILSIGILFYLIALMFHWTQLIILPFLLYLILIKNVKFRSFGFYIIILCIFFILDIINFSQMISEILIFFLEYILSILNKVDHYYIYLNTVDQLMLTWQYIFYRLTAVFFACFKVKDKKYIKLLNGYFIGMLMYSLFNSFGVITRIQWPLLILNVYLMYYYIRYYNEKTYNKVICVTAFTIAQSIMAQQYLG